MLRDTSEDEKVKQFKPSPFGMPILHPIVACQQYIFEAKSQEKYSPPSPEGYSGTLLEIQGQKKRGTS